MVHREHVEVEKWTKQVWLNCPEKGSNNNTFQYCLDSHGYLLHMRAIQGHSGGNKVVPSLQDNVKMPDNWIVFFNHVGSSHDCNSNVSDHV